MRDDIALLHQIRFLVSGVMSANLKSQSSLVPAITNILADSVCWLDLMMSEFHKFEIFQHRIPEQVHSLFMLKLLISFKIVSYQY